MKNFMIYLFSRQARLNMSYMFIAMNIFQIVAGCVMTGGSIYICLSITKYLYAEKAEIKFVFTVFGIFGTHVIIHYLVGIKIVERCFVKSHKRSTKRILTLWLILCAITIAYLLILATMIVKISKHIVRSIRHSMEKGMRHYLNDPVWKHTLDRWQFSLRCCGVNNFQDWYSISWLDKYHIDVDSPAIQNLLLSKDHLHLPVVPWSCCDIKFPMQCFHDPIQQINAAHIWKDQPELAEMSMNRMGCLDAIRYPIEIALVSFLIICILLIIVQVAITIVARFLYTSCRNAVIMHRTAGSAPGWLFSRDCLADKRGRSLSEVMLDLEKNSDSEYEEDEYDEEEETDDETKRMVKKISPKSPKPPPVIPRRDSLDIYKKIIRSKHEHDMDANISREKKGSKVIAGYTYHGGEDSQSRDPGAGSTTKPNLHYNRSHKHVHDSKDHVHIQSKPNIGSVGQKHESKFESLHRHFSPMHNDQYPPPQISSHQHKSRPNVHATPETEQSDHIQTFDYVNSSQSVYYSAQSLLRPIESDKHKRGLQEFGSYQKYHGDVAHDNRKYSRSTSNQDMKRQVGQHQSNVGDSGFQRLRTITEADPSLPEKDYEVKYMETNQRQNRAKYNNVDSARNPVSDRTEGALMLR